MVIKLIFIDSGFLYSYINRKDKQHTNTLSIMRLALAGVYGKIVLSNYITDEVLTLAKVRTGRCQCSKDILEFIKSKKEKNNIILEILLDKSLIQLTEENYEKYCEKGLSFTDCSILAVMKSFQIENLASFDTGFKGLVPNLLN